MPNNRIKYLTKLKYYGIIIELLEVFNVNGKTTEK